MSHTKPIPDTVTLHVPFRIVKRGGRKSMQVPNETPQCSTDSTLVKALARAFRWKRMLESGEFATSAELAHYEKIAPSYLTRILRMTFLAPDMVEAIVNGRQPTSMSAETLRAGVEDDWTVQRRAFGIDQSYVRSSALRPISVVEIDFATS